MAKAPDPKTVDYDAEVQPAASAPKRRAAKTAKKTASAPSDDSKK